MSIDNSKISALIGLSNNDSRVLLALLNQVEPVPAGQLANHVSLSVFQVRYSIKKISACLKFSGIDIVQKPNEGILLDVSDEQKTEIISMIHAFTDKELSLNAHERINLILQLLLTTNEGFKLSSISKKFETSSTSFYRDFKEAKRWLRNRGIIVVSDNRKNICLTGSEIQIRNAIQEILLENLGENIILQSCLFPVEEIQIHEFDKRIYFQNLYSYISSLNLPDCEKQIRLLEEKNECALLDRVHIELALLLGITLSRIQHQHFLQENGIGGQSTDSEYLQDAQTIFQSLGAKLDIAYKKWEYKHFAYLISISIENGLYSGEELTRPQNILKKRNLSKRIIQESAKYFYAGLIDDIDLLNCLDWELTHPSDSKINNPDEKKGLQKKPVQANSLDNFISKIIRPLLLDEYARYEPHLSNAIANHIHIALEKARNSLFKRRVLLVCGAGMATAYSLKSQITTKFPEIKITGITSAFELAHDDTLLKDCDAVISTIPLGPLTRIPQIQVNAFLTEQDKAEIRRILELSEIGKEGFMNAKADLSLSFLEILTCKTIRCQVEAKFPQDVIEKAGKLLLDKESIWPSYIKAMKDLFTIYGPYMVIAPNTAFLHAGPEMGARKLSASILTLKQPVIFGHKDHDPVSIAVAFSSPHITSNTKVLTDVFNFFTIEENRHRILSSVFPQEIYTCIRKYFHRENLSFN